MEASATSKLLVSDIASSVDHVPSNYVRPISDRPNLSDVETSVNSIPLIDLGELHGPNRADIIHQFAHACSSYGFFQVTPRLIHFRIYSVLLQYTLCFFSWFYSVFSRLYSTLFYCSKLYFISSILCFIAIHSCSLCILTLFCFDQNVTVSCSRSRTMEYQKKKSKEWWLWRESFSGSPRAKE